MGKLKAKSLTFFFSASVLLLISASLSIVALKSTSFFPDFALASKAMAQASSNSSTTYSKSSFFKERDVRAGVPVMEKS